MAIWGRSLNSLIAGTRAGDDDLLIRAARIDPGVVTGPTGAARVNRAILFGERQFLKRLWGAMGKPPKKRSGVFNDIRLAMAVLRESRAELTDDELVWLFCDKLKLYSRRGDPAKSLRKLMGEVEPMSTTDKWPEWVVNLFKTGE